MLGRLLFLAGVTTSGLIALLLAQNNFYTLTSDHYIFWSGRQTTTYLNGSWYTAFFYSDDSTGPKYPGIIQLDSLAQTLLRAVIWNFSEVPVIYGLTARTDQSLLWLMTVRDTLIFITLNETLSPLDVWRVVLDSPLVSVRWCLSSDSVVWMYGLLSDASVPNRHRLLKVNLASRTLTKWRVQTTYTPYDVACRRGGQLLYLLNARESDEESYVFPIPLSQLDSPIVTLTGFGVNINVVGTWGAPLLHIYPVAHSDSIVLVVGRKKGAGISASDALVGYFVYPNSQLVYRSFGSTFRSDYPCGASGSDLNYVVSALSMKSGGRNFTLVLSSDLSMVVRDLAFDDVFNNPGSRRCHTSSAPHGFLVVGERVSRASDTLGNVWYTQAELRWAFVHWDTSAPWTCTSPLQRDIKSPDSLLATKLMWQTPFSVYRLGEPTILFQDNTLPYDTLVRSDLRVMPLCLTGEPLVLARDSVLHLGSPPWQVHSVRRCGRGLLVEIVCMQGTCVGTDLLVQLHTLQGKTIAGTRVVLTHSGTQALVFLDTGYLTPGLYLLTITDASFVQTMKIVVSASRAF